MQESSTYVWLDYSSIPQRRATFRRETGLGRARLAVEVREAPSLADSCDQLFDGLRRQGTAWHGRRQTEKRRERARDAGSAASLRKLEVSAFVVVAPPVKHKAGAAESGAALPLSLSSLLLLLRVSESRSLSLSLSLPLSLCLSFVALCPALSLSHHLISSHLISSSHQSGLGGRVQQGHLPVPRLVQAGRAGPAAWQKSCLFSSG